MHNNIESQTENITDVILENVTVEYTVQAEKTRSFKKYAINMLVSKKNNRTFSALNNVSFTVNRGEIFGVIGKNGAGKSTLMKVIARVLIPTRGRVYTNGRVYPLLQLGAGFHPELTGLENIYLNGTLLGHSRDQITQKIESIIEFSELKKFINVPVRNYSSGMRARLGFSIATAWQPQILILDEVLAVGDIAFQDKCYDRMKVYQEMGTTTIMVSHSPAKIASMCSRAMWLHEGEIKKIGEAKKVTAAYKKEKSQNKKKNISTPLGSNQSKGDQE